MQTASNTSMRGCATRLIKTYIEVMGKLYCRDVFGNNDDWYRLGFAIKQPDYINLHNVTL